jgi:hypothetical protein
LKSYIPAPSSFQLKLESPISSLRSLRLCAQKTGRLGSRRDAENAEEVEKEQRFPLSLE